MSYKMLHLSLQSINSNSQTTSEVNKAPKVIPQEPTLDGTITEAKNKLKTGQLEKRIEQIKQARKPKKV